MEFELFYLVNGKFIARSEGKNYEPEAGDVFCVFPFVEYSYEQIGDNLAVVMIVNPESIEQIA